jgi:hypothetical protein
MIKLKSLLEKKINVINTANYFAQKLYDLLRNERPIFAFNKFERELSTLNLSDEQIKQISRKLWNSIGSVNLNQLKQLTRQELIKNLL